MQTLNEMTDGQLVQQYVESKSQQAFAELAERHTHWIYSCALRQVRDSHVAEDVAQAVFILLAQKAATLRNRPALNAWLFRVTRYAAKHALRTDGRRKHHERMAASMIAEASIPDGEPAWQQLQPCLDELVGRLPEDDRQAVVLRFYQQKAMAEVGAALNVSEDAAKKRVARAVGRLRTLLGRRGIMVPAATLGTCLIAGTTQPASASLVASCAAAAGVPTSVAALAIAKGVSSVMFAGKLKLAILAICLVTLIPFASGAIYLLAVQSDSKGSRSGSPATTASNTSIPRDHPPDSSALLQGTWAGTMTKGDDANPPGESRKIKVIILQDKISAADPDGQNAMLNTFTTDVSKDPHWFDIVSNGEPYRGIFLLVGDKLTIRISGAIGARPKDFTTGPFKDHQLAFLTRDMNPTTAPAQAATVKSNEAEDRIKCAGNLRYIGVALVTYVAAHGHYPPDLATLLQDGKITAEILICPSTGKQLPQNLSPEQLAEWVRANSDYVYVGAGLAARSATRAIVVAYDAEGNHGGEGANVLFGDGHIQFLDPEMTAKAIRESDRMRGKTR